MAKKVPNTSPTEGKDVVKHLAAQLAYMRSFWSLNQALFNRDGVTLQALPEEFFNRLDDATFQVIDLAISRMTDPASTGRHRNASIAQAVDLLRLGTSHPQLLAKSADARRVVEGYRMKHLAHTCFHVHVEHTQPYPKNITRADVRQAVCECSWVIATLCAIVGVKSAPETDRPDDWLAKLATLAIKAQNFQQLHDRASNHIAITGAEIVKMGQRTSAKKRT
jgi:hypothetical protein